jgi:hypothetical protein
LKNKKIISVLKIIWILAVILGGIYYVYANYLDILNYLNTISVLKLLISFFLLILVRLIYIGLVRESLFNFEWKPNFIEVFSFVSISQLGKYIPGGVWHFVARYSAYKGNRLSNKDIGKAFLIENYWVVVGSLFFSMFFILLSNPITLFEKYKLSFLLSYKQILLPFILLCWMTLLILTDYLSKVKITQLIIINNLKRFISQFIMWILYGLSFLFLLPITKNMNVDFFVIGSIVLSFLVGFLAIIAPGGIGFREFAGVILFSTIFNETEITTYLLVHRFLYTIIEFIMGFVSFIFLRKKPPSNVLTLSDQ